jgi:cysteine synthase B
MAIDALPITTKTSGASRRRCYRVGGTPDPAPQSRSICIRTSKCGKAEWHNPSGSVKDRPAAFILRQAFASGRLGRGRVLLDSTSGNMGIAYASFCAALGIYLHLMVPANASPERLTLLRLLGARLTLTDPLEGADGARAAAGDGHRDPDRYFYADQYSNPANWQAHYQTTKPRDLRADRRRITHFVAAWGPRAPSPGPGGSSVRRGAGRFSSPSTGWPDARAGGPQTPGHQPTPAIFDPTTPDMTVAVRTEAPTRWQRRLAAEEGSWWASRQRGRRGRSLNWPPARRGSSSPSSRILR